MKDFFAPNKKEIKQNKKENNRNCDIKVRDGPKATKKHHNFFSASKSRADNCSENDKNNHKNIGHTLIY